MSTSASNQVDRETALEMVRQAEKNFGSGAVEAILDGFTDNVVIRFADLPEMRGKADAERFLRSRFARQQNYELTKTLRMVSGNMIGNFWEGTWNDARTGKKMRGRGTEFWTVQGDKVAVWEATFNVWQDGADPATPIL